MLRKYFATHILVNLLMMGAKFWYEQDPALHCHLVFSYSASIAGSHSDRSQVRIFLYFLFKIVCSKAGTSPMQGSIPAWFTTSRHLWQIRLKVRIYIVTNRIQGLVFQDKMLSLSHLKLKSLLAILNSSRLSIPKPVDYHSIKIRVAVIVYNIVNIRLNQIS